MKKIIITTAYLIVTHCSFLTNLHAETKSHSVSPKALTAFKDALGKAYQHNPSIHAALRQYYATVEEIPNARAGWLPNVNIIGSSNASKQFSNRKGPAMVEPGRTKNNQQNTSLKAELSQNLYAGGQTMALTAQAQNTVLAAKMAFINEEQKVLMDAITAYLDLWQAIEILNARLTSERFNQRSFEQLKAQAEVGEKTRTEVAEAESQLATAVAQRLEAAAQLEAARAKYVQIIGEEAPHEVEEPPLLYPQKDLPKNLEEFKETANRHSPEILRAFYAQKAQDYAVSAAEGKLLPSVDATASGDRSVSTARTRRDLTGNQSLSVKRNQYDSTGAVGIRVTIPLYQRGAEWSGVRRANQQKYQQLNALRVARRAVMHNAVQVWEIWKSREASIQQLKISVKAAALNLEGKRQEYQVGEKTLTDVLDAEQRLVQAEVNLINTKRSYLLAFYQLLQVSGTLLPTHMSLSIDRHEIESYTDDISSKIFGIGDLRTQYHVNEHENPS